MGRQKAIPDYSSRFGSYTLAYLNGVDLLRACRRQCACDRHATLLWGALIGLIPWCLVRQFGPYMGQISFWQRLGLMSVFAYRRSALYFIALTTHIARNAHTVNMVAQALWSCYEWSLRLRTSIRMNDEVPLRFDRLLVITR